MATATPPPAKGSVIGDNASAFRQASDFLDIDFSNPGNWIALSRNVLSHPIVGAGQPVKPENPKRGAYSRMEAWIDLLALAQYKPARINNKGEVMTLLVGQLMGARSFLAERWNWSEKTVRGYLATLKAEGMITDDTELPNSELNTGHHGATKRNNQFKIITISNYSKYQFINEAIESYILNLKGPAKGQQRASKGPESNTGNTANKDSILSAQGSGHIPDLPEQPKPEVSKRAAPRPKPTMEQFDRFWAIYPKRTGKQRAQERFMALSPEDAELAIAAAGIFAAEVRAKGTEDGFVKMAEGWLNAGRFRDYRSDGAGDPYEGLVSPDGKKRWGWWRGREEALSALPAERWREAVKTHRPNGTWPWWVLAAPPGHEECLMPAEVVAEFGYADIYRGKIHHS